MTRFWSRGATRMAMLLVLLVGWALLVYRLDAAPPGFQHDQTFTSLDAMQIVGGSRPIYFPDNFGREPLFMYSVAVVYSLTDGHYVWSLHFTAALWSMLTLAATGALARHYLSRAAAVCAVALMAGSFWFLLAGRLGLEVIALVPLAAGMFYFLGRGLTRRSRSSFIAAGILGGVANYTYIASRTLYLVVALLMACAVLRWIAGLRAYQKAPVDRSGPGKWSASGLPGLLVSLVVMLLVNAPMLLYLFTHPGTVDGRIGELNGGIVAAVHGDVQPIAQSALDTVRSLLWRGSVALPYQYNVPGRPALQPLWAVCLVLGLGLTLLRRRNWQTAVLLAALFAGLLPNLLTSADALYMRAVYAMPLIFILVARGLWACGAGLGWLAAQALPGRSSARLAFMPIAAGVLLPVLLIWHAASDATAYYVTWAQAERTQRIYNADFRAAMPVVDSQPADEQIFMGTDRLLDLDSATYRFYEPLRTDVNWFEAADSPPLPAQDSALYLLPTSTGLPPALAALQEFGRDPLSIPSPWGGYDLVRGFHLRAEDVATFLQRRGAVSLAQPVTFGGALRLDTAAFQDQGGSAAVSTSWTAVAAWPRAARPGYPPARPKFSLSLTGEAGYRWSQADQSTSLPFTTWRAGQRLLEISYLPLPADLPPGHYSLRLTVYDDEGGPLPVTHGDRGAEADADPVVAEVDLSARIPGPALQPPYAAGDGQGENAGLQLLGKWEALESLTAGVPTDVHLSWQAARPIDTAALRFQVRGRGPDGSLLWEQSLPPREPLPAVWAAGQEFRLSHRLEPRTPHTGLIEAQIEICAQDGEAALGCWQIARAQVSNRAVQMAFPGPPTHPYAADWSGHVALAGYDALQSSQGISLTLYWRAGSLPVTGPLKRFVHVTAADGSILAQSDAAFEVEGVPAALWQARECLLDKISLTLPPGRPATMIYTGLYDPGTGERMPVQLASGAAAPDGRVALPLPGQAPGQ